MSSQNLVTSVFSDLPLAPELQRTLAHLQFITATPIQTACIPAAIEGKDIIGIAQTGTGKTFAFGLPLLQRLHGTDDKALIVVPTRELALQVEESLRRVAANLGTKFAVLIGGASMGQQKTALRSRPNVIIATPGRLIDHMKQKTVSLNQTTILVLDEADRMFDMGFAPQVEQILHGLPTDRQTMLFSATMPDGISQMVKRYMKLPVRIEIAPQGSVADKLVQEVFIVRGAMKSQLLEKLLGDYNGTVLVFVRTKYAATRISNLIRAMGHSSAELHSNRSLSQRKQALQGFKDGRYRVLVATDIAARGIDVTNIELVVNYDLPENPEDYVHRIGRTGRAGMEGKAISFAAPDQISLMKRIERLTRTRLPQSALPKELPELRLPPKGAFQREDEGGSFRGRREGGFRRSPDRGDRGERSERPRFRSFTPSQQVWTKESIRDENAAPKEGDTYDFGKDNKVIEEERPRRTEGFRPRRSDTREGGDRGGYNRERSSSGGYAGRSRRPFGEDRGSRPSYAGGNSGGFRGRRESGSAEGGRSESGYSRSPNRSFERSSSDRPQSGYARPAGRGFSRSSDRPSSDRPYSPRSGGFGKRKEFGSSQSSEGSGPRGGFGRPSSRSSYGRPRPSRDGGSSENRGFSSDRPRRSGGFKGKPRSGFGNGGARTERNYSD